MHLVQCSGWLTLAIRSSAMPVSPVQLADHPMPLRSGCHQPAEDVLGMEIHCAWFTKGLQVIDISNPFSLKVAVSLLPPIPNGSKQVLSSDVCWDEHGLIYLFDRDRGLYIPEREKKFCV